MSTIRAPPKQWDLVNFRGSGGFTGRSPVQVTKSGKHVVEFRVGWLNIGEKFGECRENNKFWITKKEAGIIRHISGGK